MNRIFLILAGLVLASKLVSKLLTRQGEHLKQELKELREQEAKLQRQHATLSKQDESLESLKAEKRHDEALEARAKMKNVNKD